MRVGLRTLTPLGWLAVAVGGALIVAVLAGGLGFRWDPLELDRRRLDAARVQAAAGDAAAAARRCARRARPRSSARS